MKIKQDDLGDVVVWRWIGSHGCSPKAFDLTARAREMIQSELPASKPILVDLRKLRYSYNVSLHDAIHNTYLLQRQGHPVAVLLSPKKPEIRNVLRAMEVEIIMKLFEDKELALAYLRSRGSSASG